MFDKEKIIDIFDRHAVMHTIGASITLVEEGAVDITLPFRKDLTQQHGFMHAGMITTIVDSACGLAALTTMPPEGKVLTVEFKINFMSPAMGERFIGKGRVLKAGRTLTTTRGDVFAVREDGSEKLIAAMQATMFCVMD